MSGKSILTHSVVLAIGLTIGLLLMYPVATSRIWFVDISETFTQPPTGKINVKITRANGAIEEYINHNIVVTIGLTRVRGFLDAANDPVNATDDIALSNDTSPQANWVKLPNEETGNGLTRADGTESVINATAYQSVKTFTATGTVTVQCAGLHWDPTSDTDDNLFAAATFTQVTLNNNDQIQITWTVNLQSG